MYIIITASPNSDGLTAACGEAAKSGIESGGEQAEIISLNKLGITGCRACGNGWGTCREQHTCVIGDAFDSLQQKMIGAQGVFLITPVYWGQPAESMKYFLDRLRRCDALRPESRRLEKKPVSLVAAAGGSGNGTITCLADMEMWCRHTGATPVDRIGVSRFNRGEVLAVIEKAAERMAKG